MDKETRVYLAIERHWRSTEDIAEYASTTLSYTTEVLNKLQDLNQAEKREFMGFHYWRVCER